MSFNETERRQLINAPGIGPRVVERLEQVGFDSLAAMQRSGTDAVVERVCRMLGSNAWTNRRRALNRLLAETAERAPA
ncbi:MAG: hypothetical protein KGN16_09610 [Burkholderiales bacterium]|nr:hypothetical protein [Burkholderiales bacterium]